MPDLISRRIASLANDYLDSFRILIVNGPRQSGKTTLLQELNRRHHGLYVTLDDGGLRAAAHADPTVFVDGRKPLMIDEIQRGGNDLVLAIKATVDRHTDRGQFVLAGSTRFLATPSLSESLAGRAGIVEIWPFAQQELAGTPRSFLDAIFANPEELRSAPPSSYERPDYFALIARGFYPEAVTIVRERVRSEWYRTYVQAVVDTDIREMAEIEQPSTLRQLLQLSAASTAQEFNASKAGNDLQLHRTTVQRYLGLLETVFLIRFLPPWSRNLAARAVRRAKLHITDTGLAAHLLSVDADGLAARISPARGPLVETFIVNELAKQATWSTVPVQLFHWRVSQGAEVDLVIERTNGSVVGVEAKSTDTLDQRDFAGLTLLRDSLGSDFVHGVVFYTGQRALSFGDRLTALPLSTLWEN